ncbi:FAS1-like dehydratase domain-containing protein [Microbacterium sp.]|uniref:FAS1-like dehydratase domain-containing protein n=1 Tax=Microbacterium sp. TaxID=51671 RepID=UPI003C292E81
MAETTKLVDGVDFTAWVGASEVASDTADRSSTAGLSALLDYPTGHAGDRLFPLGHWLHFRPTERQSGLGEDGHPALGGFLPPVPLPRRMWAGSRIEFHSAIRIGQDLRRTSTIDSITFKQGSTGRLCFIVLRHDVLADKILALTEHQSLVYREAATASPPLPATAPEAPTPEAWEWVRSCVPTEVMLFRYSALTFNAHRIHYDLPYATGTEGYPALVVQGPLVATLLLDAFARRNPGHDVTRFEFAAKRPLFVDRAIQLCGRSTETGRAELAAVDPQGLVSVTATVEFRGT